jgi:type I restriction enzyme S subunit
MSKSKYTLPPTLPELPSGWSWKALGELMDEKRGICYGIVQPGKHHENGVPMVNSGDILDSKPNLNVGFKVSQELHAKFKRSTLKGGEVLLTLVGANFGRVALAPKEYAGYNCSRAVGVIPVVSDAEYIMYALQTPIVRHFMDNWANTTAQPTFNLGDATNLPIAWSPANVRDEIRSTISSLDKKLSVNRQTNQTLEQMAQAIFKSWFVDFEPTHAKIDAIQKGEDPERAAMAAISGKTIDELDQLSSDTQQQLRNTAALFPDKLVDSELGEIPEGWRVDKIGDEVGVVGGGTPSTKSPEFWEDGHHHWTTPKDMSNLTDKILLETDRKITNSGLAKISSGLLPVNTVLMSSRAPVGYLAIAKIPVAINQGYIAMKCDGVLTPEYIIQWANSVMDEIQQRASGTTFAEISKTNFRLIPVIIPKEDVVKEYSTIVKSLYEKITQTLIETKSLTEIRDSLLPKLLSGEIELVG